MYKILLLLTAAIFLLFVYLFFFSDKKMPREERFFGGYCYGPNYNCGQCVSNDSATPHITFNPFHGAFFITKEFNY